MNFLAPFCVIIAGLVFMASSGFCQTVGLKLSKSPQDHGYCLVRQKISSLEKDRKYKFLAEIDGKYIRGKYDTIVEISEENALVHGPLESIYKDSVTTIEIICSTPKSFENPHIRLAFASTPNVFRKVEFIDLVTGENLLSNSTFEKGLSGWEAQGGTVELVKLSDASEPRNLESDQPESPAQINQDAMVDFEPTGNDYLDGLLEKKHQDWATKRGKVIAEIDEKYFEKLEVTKKQLVIENKIAEAEAYDNALKGNAEGKNAPPSLTALRDARVKLVEKETRPINKDYYDDLKEIREAFQSGGSLKGVKVVDDEMKRLVENFSKAPQQAARKSSLFDKPMVEKIEEISLTKLEPAQQQTRRDLEIYVPEMIDRDSLVAQVILGELNCDSFLLPYAPSMLRYKVPPNMRWFSAIGTRTKVGGSEYRFIVKSEGKVLFESKPLNLYKNHIVSIVVEIPNGATNIELICDDMGSQNNKQSVWANPMFRTKKPTEAQVLSLK